MPNGGAMDELERANNNSSESSERGTKRTQSSMRKWIADQVAALGLAMGDEVSTERLLVYVEDLFDIPYERLAMAFQKARREYEYPKLPPLAFIRPTARLSAQSADRHAPQ